MVQHADIDHTGLPGVGGGGGAMEQISDTVLGSDTTFDLTSIPGTYNHLKLIGQIRSTRAAQTNDFVIMRFNNDSGSNYETQNLNGQSTTISGTENIGGTSFTTALLVPAASSPAGAACTFVIDVPNYAATVFRKGFFVTSQSSLADSSTNMRLYAACGEWRSTAAITRITLLSANSASFLTGSRVTLYGIT